MWEPEVDRASECLSSTCFASSSNLSMSLWQLRVFSSSKLTDKSPSPDSDLSEWHLKRKFYGKWIIILKYLLIDLSIIPVWPTSVAYLRQKFKEILFCDWIQPMVRQRLLWGRVLSEVSYYSLRRQLFYFPQLFNAFQPPKMQQEEEGIFLNFRVKKQPKSLFMPKNSEK